MTSIAVTVPFTVVFLVVGGYALVRLSLLVGEVGPGGDRLAELSHLLMSIAMIAMALGWTGGPSSGSGIVQLLLFGVLTLWFLGRAVARSAGHGLPSSLYHMVVCASMVWMVAAMPQLMGMPEMGSMAGGHAGHDAHVPAAALESSAAMGSPAPVWTVVTSWVFIVLLAAAGLSWARRAVRAVPSEPESSGPVGTADGAVALAVRPGSTRLVHLVGPRTDAWCHVLMSIGMAASLVAML
ncbi:DUF5134 domain-containing protein [Pseudonocardia sp. CA-107938]|uniref:DUF5134 domain-containing protein n=1 Tax=Pseudonocardia sp. CA-107938 TaxID=3240021 RepID=UPI003D8A43EC